MPRRVTHKPAEENSEAAEVNEVLESEQAGPSPAAVVGAHPNETEPTSNSEEVSANPPVSEENNIPNYPAEDVSPVDTDPTREFVEGLSHPDAEPSPAPIGRDQPRDEAQSFGLSVRDYDRELQRVRSEMNVAYQNFWGAIAGDDMDAASQGLIEAMAGVTEVVKQNPHRV